MSRKNNTDNHEICGDCGSLDATWASLNKGILLCSQCCSVHRSLGRHISLVKSLQKSTWPGKQMSMMMSLVNNGVNSIWEHAILESNSKLIKKKPNPRDSLEVKSEFIKAKHQMCVFSFRHICEEDPICVVNELGKQLHASVRTANLETSFRLLATGADPNYFHDEKGTTPLHVAVSNEQFLQLEILLIYGADPTCPDAHGQTSLDYAKNNANKSFFNRLIENKYEVTDTLSYYLTMRKPDHQSGAGILMPQSGFFTNSVFLEKLQKLPNHLFEELVGDVYDEVDRRQTEAVWLSCVDAIELNTVPFLPVDPTLSTTRNQGRQKLARFSTPELKNLIYDILVDVQRRQNVSERTSFEDPVYDTVASDEDFGNLPEASNSEVLRLANQLKCSNSIIIELKSEIDKLRGHVASLIYENHDLKNKLSKISNNSNEINNTNMAYSSLDTILTNPTPGINKKKCSSDDSFVLGRKFQQRPSSMYETRAASNNQGLRNHRNLHLEKRYSLKAPIETHTAHITKSVQQLWQCINESNIDECIPRAEKVKIATAKLIANLPREMFADMTKVMLDVLPRLQPECKEYVTAHRDNNTKLMEFHMTKIREYAYILVSNTRDILAKSSSCSGY